MEVSCHLQLGSWQAKKEPKYAWNSRLAWAPDLVWALFRREQVSYLCQESNHCCLVVQPAW